MAPAVTAAVAAEAEWGQAVAAAADAVVIDQKDNTKTLTLTNFSL